MNETIVGEPSFDSAEYKKLTKLAGRLQLLVTTAVIAAFDCKDNDSDRKELFNEYANKAWVIVKQILDQVYYLRNEARQLKTDVFALQDKNWKLKMEIADLSRALNRAKSDHAMKSTDDIDYQAISEKLDVLEELSGCYFEVKNQLEELKDDIKNDFIKLGLAKEEAVARLIDAKLNG